MACVRAGRVPFVEAAGFSAFTETGERESSPWRLLDRNHKMPTPTQPRRAVAVLGAACAKLLFCFERTRISRALPPAWTPVLRRLHPVRPRAAGTAWAAAIAVALAAAAPPAQAQFVSLTGFGDSYADTGAAPGGAMRLIGVPPYWPCTAPYASCRFTGSTNFVDSLQSIYGLPGLTNYSIGGARTDNTNTMPPSPTATASSTNCSNSPPAERTSPMATSSRSPSAATICRPQPHHVR